MTSAARMMEEMAEDWGPGPPPPEFKIPPPPLPPFMLPDLEEEDCQNVLDSHLAVCDTTFPSIKSTSSSGLANQPWISLILAAAGLLFLGLCVAIFLVWRRWRSRNHLSYLRAKSHFDSQPGEPSNSEHPLIYDDANIQFYRNGNSTYLLESSSNRPSALVRDLSGLSQQTSETRLLYNGFSGDETESRIYEEVFLTEDPYSGHYSRPLESTASTSMGCNSIKRIVTHPNGVDSDQWPMQTQYSTVYAPTTANMAESSFSSKGHNCKKKKAHSMSSSNCSCSSCSSSSNSGTKDKWPQVIYQHKDEGLFSTLWSKQRPQREKRPSENTTTGNNQWMTLRVPITSEGETMQLREQNRPLQPLRPSQTLGRQCNNNVMPNPDDILPKEAWTDFSGTDEWPQFEDNRLYVNCPEDRPQRKNKPQPPPRRNCVSLHHPKSVQKRPKAHANDEESMSSSDQEDMEWHQSPLLMHHQ